MIIRILFCLSSLLLLPSLYAGDDNSQEELRLQRKLALLDNMLHQGNTVERIEESQDVEALRLLNISRLLYKDASASLSSGHIPRTRVSLDEALRMIVSGLALARKGEGSTAADKARYQVFSNSLASMERTMQENPEIRIDKDQLNTLKLNADKALDSADYQRANHYLSEAYKLSVAAVSLENHNKTVVSSLDFATPGDEYKYEVRRFNGNLEVVDLLSKDKSGSAKLNFILQSRDRAISTRDLAIQEAEKGDFLSAILRMESANEQLSSAMGMLGIRF